MKEVDLGEPTSIPWSRLMLGMRSARMRNEQRYCGQEKKYFLIQDLRRSKKKSYLVQGDLMQTSIHGLVMCKVMQRNVWSDLASWRIKQLSSFSESQLHALMTINSKKKNWDVLENCEKYALKLSWQCLYLTRIGRPDILWSLNKLARAVTKLTRACDKRLARLILLHTPHEWVQTILSCGKNCTTMQVGTVSRLWFCRRPWRLEVNIRRNSVHFRKSYIRTNKLDVQETNIQSYTVQRNLRLFLLMQVYAWMGSQLSIFGVWFL